jgi:2-haloalkanoic acid dehalogenase type II
MSRRLSDFSTLTFDCYGTLIDWEEGLWHALQPLLAANHRNDIPRAEALTSYGSFESTLQEESPSLSYPNILARVHSSFAQHYNLSTTADLDADFASSLPLWPAFFDSAAALQRLAERYRLVILSNVHRAGFQASSRQLGVEFDAVYTAEDIGSYKPDRRNFDYLLRHLHIEFGVAPEQILHTAQSLHHDHAPASALGLATAWIDRQGLAEGGSWGATRAIEDLPEVDFRFPNLAAMADAVADDALSAV